MLRSLLEDVRDLAVAASIPALIWCVFPDAAMAAAPADCAVSAAGWLGSLFLAFIGGGFIGSAFLALFVASRFAAAERARGEDYEASISGREG